MGNFNTKFPDQLKFLDWPKPIDKGTRNALKSMDTLVNFFEEDCLDKNVLVISLELAFKIWHSPIYKCYNITLFGSKRRRAHYKEDWRDGKDKKDKKSKENKRGKRGIKSYCRNKKNSKIGKNSNSETNIDHYIIY